MQPIISIKQACEKHLKSITPDLPTAYEGFNFTPPSTMYQICQFVILNPSDPTLGDGYYRERVDLQVFVVGVSGKGTLEALQRAELIRSHFAKGTTLIQDGITLSILRTPKISGSMISEGRVVIPVLISVTTEVFS